MQMVTLSYKTSFDAAHQLPYHTGKCRNLHGHTWTCRFYVTGPIQGSTGMLMDFADLKSACKAVTDAFDHNLVNNVLLNPTAELMAVYLTRKLKEHLTLVQGRDYLKYFGVEVQEGDGGTCDYSEEVNE